MISRRLNTILKTIQDILSSHRIQTIPTYQVAVSLSDRFLSGRKHGRVPANIST